MNEEDTAAKIIWDYMQLHQDPVKSDMVFCLCSHDKRVAKRAADLLLDGYGKFLIFSGGAGKLTKDLFNEPEAEVFKKIAIAQGIDEDKIITENESHNTGENITFTYELLQIKNLKPKSFVLVQKPYMERRTYATFKKKWPDDSTKITITSPRLTFEEYVAGDISKEDVINIMVGDLQRIKEYPKLGFQIEQIIPETVWSAFEMLVQAGYNRHLLAQ